MAESTSVVPDDLVELGRVVSAYGIRGWIKIQPFSAQADVLRGTKMWWMTRPSPVVGKGALSCAPQALKIVQVRSQGADLVAQLHGVTDRDDAEAMKGATLSVSRRNFPSLDSDEVYWIDLIGCQVFGVDADGAQVLLGEVAEVVDNGAHGVLRVARLTQELSGTVVPVLDGKGRSQELLVPYVAAHIESVDLQARRIISDWPLDF